MSELILKNFMKTDNIDEVYDKETQNFICDDMKYNIYQIPKVQKTMFDEPLYYMQKDSKEYFRTRLDSMFIVFILELGIVNQSVEIENTYMMLAPEENTILDTFFEPSIEQLKAFMENRIPELLARLPYSDNEVQLYREMINRYTERVIKTQVKPTIYKEKFLTELYDRLNDNEDKENKPFVTGQENWYKGKCYTKITEISKDYNIDNSTLYSRRDKGMSIKEMIETPVAKRGRGARK